MRLRALAAAALLAVLALPARAARPPLGAGVYGARDGFADYPARLARLRGEGFRLVSLVPTWPYVDLDRIDFSGGPSWARVEDAVALSLSSGVAVVLKPHLDPGASIWGYVPPDPKLTRGWRWNCGWRGYFDVDPMSKDYREGLVGGALQAIKGALARQKGPVPPVRLELGSELMESVAARPERWARLLDWAKARRKRLGLDGQVVLSHNFEHHFEMPGEVVDRLSPAGRAALSRYVGGLDAIALSQYMDLTAAMPAGERGKRLPTAAEVAAALALHERNFRREILEKRLGLAPSRQPPLHIGEFGVGVGGLRRPNEWSGTVTPAREKELAAEIARGYEGLTLYLSSDRGVRSASLWLLGRHYDVFGWDDPASANAGAQAAVRAYLSRP